MIEHVFFQRAFIFHFQGFGQLTFSFPCKEDVYVSGTTAMVMKQQEALREVQLQLQWLTDRLQLEGLRQAGKFYRWESSVGVVLQR